jgi:outer membrane protein assembly factor BamD
MKIRPTWMWAILFLFLLSLSWGCAGRKGTDLKTVQGNPETLYKQGLASFNKRLYKNSLEKFNELKSTFPDSPPYTILAELKIADSHFHNKDYVEAIAAYEEFKKIHPSHEEIPYVQYQIGMAYFNQMLTLDRDQTPTIKALSSFEYLIANSPPGLFTEKGKEKIGICMKRLADHEFYIGNFYYKKEKYQAAAARFEGLLGKYPKIQGEDQTLFLLAKSYVELGQWEKAGARLNQLINEHGKSPYTKEAKALLDEVGKTKKGSPPIISKKEVKKKDGPGEPESSGIPLIKFEEEGRKPVSLSLVIPSESSRPILPKDTQTARASSVGIPSPDQSRSWRDSAPAPAHEGRTQPIPPSTPSLIKPDAEVKSGPWRDGQMASLPNPPGQPARKEKSEEGELLGLKQEKSGEPAQPVEITSDRVETYTNDNLIIFKGNVVARQKDMVIYADSVDAVILGDGKGIEKVIAGGNVKIQQGLRTANCQKAVFYNTEKKVVLTGDPKVWEGEQMISGDEIIFDIDQNRVEVRGGSSGRGKAKVYPKGEFERSKPNE